MKNLFKIILLLMLVVPVTTFAQRETEINYPPGPSEIETPVDIETPFPEYVRYMFWLIITISGLICLGSLMYAGFLIVTSGGNPGQRKKAMSKIWLAFLGGGLVLGSYVLSNTINPQLVVPRAINRPTAGIILYDNAGCSGEELEISQNTPEIGFEDEEAQSMRFISPAGILRIRGFPRTNYRGTPNWYSSIAQTSSDVCIDFSSPIQSIDFFWELPGVYFCTEEYQERSLPGSGFDPESTSFWECTGQEIYLTQGTALLNANVNDKIKGVKLRPFYKTRGPFDNERACPVHPPSSVINWTRENEEGETEYFCTYPSYWPGAVLHQHADNTGECLVFLGSGYESRRTLVGTSLENEVSSATVFVTPPRGREVSGGVWLCEDADAQRSDSERSDSQRSDSGCYGPYQRLYNDDFIGPYSSDHASLVSDISDLDGIEHDSISSLIMDGQYTAVLFSERDFNGKCQAFQVSDSNFRDDPIGRCNCITANWGCEDCLSSLLIIPDFRSMAEQLIGP